MLLPPADIVPINSDGFFEKVMLTASFSGPDQQMRITLNPFAVSAATYDVLGLILELVGEAGTGV